MNRKSFLKKLGLGAIIAVVAPKAIANTSQQEHCEGLIPHISKNYPCQESPVTEEQYIEWGKEIFAGQTDDYVIAERQADYELNKAMNREIFFLFDNGCCHNPK